jgi:hypothetical protein
LFKSQQFGLGLETLSSMSNCTLPYSIFDAETEVKDSDAKKLFPKLIYLVQSTVPFTPYDMKMLAICQAFRSEKNF